MEMGGAILFVGFDVPNHSTIGTFSRCACGRCPVGVGRSAIASGDSGFVQTFLLFSSDTALLVSVESLKFFINPARCEMKCAGFTDGKFLLNQVSTAGFIVHLSLLWRIVHTIQRIM
jgi:hypothetical protein